MTADFAKEYLTSVTPTGYGSPQGGNNYVGSCSDEVRGQVRVGRRDA